MATFTSPFVKMAQKFKQNSVNNAAYTVQPQGQQTPASSGAGANYNLTSGSQPSPVEIATGQTAFAPQQPATQTQNQIFDPSMKNQYNSVIGGMLDGSSFDPMRTANKEAQNRIEQQQRAKAADQINRFGGIGQGLGSQIANATESDILKNRFDQSLQMQIAENDLKKQGLSAYENSINAENSLTNVDRNRVALENDKVALDQNRFNLAQSKSEAADQISADFASYMQNATDLEGASLQQIAADQGAMYYGQQLWESMGGQGAANPEWVKQQIDRVNDPVLNSTYAAAMDEAKMLLQNGYIDQQSYDLLVKMHNLGLTMGVTQDAAGNLVLKSIGTEKTEEEMAAERTELVQNMAAGTYTYADFKNNPELLQAAKESATPMDITTAWNKNSKKREFASVPEKNVPFVWMGKLAIRTSDVTGDKDQAFSITYLEDGKTDTVSSYRMPSRDKQEQLYEQFKSTGDVNDESQRTIDKKESKLDGVFNKQAQLVNSFASKLPFKNSIKLDSRG